MVLRLSRKESIVHLGNILSTDKHIQSELSRRIRSRSQAFNELERLWKHASISVTRKLRVFEVCVVSRLMYGLQTYWLKRSFLDLALIIANVLLDSS